MRIVLIVLVAAAVLAGCGRKRQEEERKQREAAEKAFYEKQAKEADAMREQAEQRFAQSQDCHTVIRNRQVLHDAMTRGGTVFSMDGKSTPLKSPEEMRPHFDEAQAYIDANCAETVAGIKKGAECNHSPGRLVCK